MKNYIKFNEEITEYKCPYCQKGYLLLNQNYFSETQYQSSIKNVTFKINENIEEYDDTYYLGTIVGKLKCNHLDCNEVTSFIGESKYYLNYYDNEIDREIEVTEKGIFFKYFIPSIHIIELKREYPEELKRILLESFSLYFSSYSACVNTVRILLEKLCELHMITSYCDNGNYKSLDKKLNELRFSKDLKTLLQAIKWIGNDGSHSLEIIKKDDLDLTYRFVKKALDEIYPSSSDYKELQVLAENIIKNNGLKK